MKVYSQTDEQQKLVKLFKKIGFKKKPVSLEFGAKNGHTMSNTRHFINEEGFEGFQWDMIPEGDFGVKKKMINKSNINTHIEKEIGNKGIDLCSIDIDGNDYWVWKAMKKNPTVVIIEFNPSIPLGEAKTIKYDPKWTFQQCRYFGASWSALLKLAEEKGYVLYDATRLNMIFVTKKALGNKKPVKGLGYVCQSGWPPDKLNREWVEV